MENLLAREIFSRKIKRLRKENNMTMEELAEKLKLKKSSISMWENNCNVPDIFNLLKIIKIFNTSFDYLLNENIKEEIFNCKCGQKYYLLFEIEEICCMPHINFQTTKPFDFAEIRCINCGLFYKFTKKIKKIEVKF